MNAEFYYSKYPEIHILDSIPDSEHRSLFNSVAYGHAVSNSGGIPYALALLSNSRALSGCLALVSGGPFYRTLEIPSTPSLTNSDLFWNGVWRLCDDLNVGTVVLNSFASFAPSMPKTNKRCASMERSEFTLDLRKRDLYSDLHSNHKRNIRKANRSGISVSRSQSTDACKIHLDLVQTSLSRRQSRGETVDAPEDVGQYVKLIDSGIGEFFQSQVQNSTVASILVLKSSSAAYYHSAGASSEGMKIGASPFLIMKTAEELAADKIKYFNLGGAGPDAIGLRRFKAGFGSVEVPLEAKRITLISTPRKQIRILLQRVMKLPGKLFRAQ